MDESADFYIGKLQAALKADGWKSARRTVGGVMHTRFGVDVQAFDLRGNSGTNLALGQFQQSLSDMKRFGATGIHYWHGLQTGNSSVHSDLDTWKQCIDAAAADTAIETRTVAQWWQRDGGAGVPV